jgi:hypothetical protein
MSKLLDDTFATKLAEWIVRHKPIVIPESLPVYVANRDELRKRPCIVLETSEAKFVPALPFTARINLAVHLFTQTDDTPVTDHGAWAAALESLLRETGQMRDDLDSPTFVLHDLIARETSTVPDETRGRETVLSFEAVVTAG